MWRAASWQVARVARVVSGRRGCAMEAIKALVERREEEAELRRKAAEVEAEMAAKKAKEADWKRRKTEAEDRRSAQLTAKDELAAFQLAKKEESRRGKAAGIDDRLARVRQSTSLEQYVEQQQQQLADDAAQTLQSLQEELHSKNHELETAPQMQSGPQSDVFVLLEH
eukprot:Skav211879  [mRNA]  locus=scaffold1431:419893:422228:+ [translate_table: standard]